MASRNIDRATPKMRQFIAQLILRAWQELRLRVIVTNVERVLIEQAALYAQGREELYTVNCMRQLAGLLPITLKDNLNCVTWTMRSEHLVDLTNSSLEDDLSHAVDVVIVSRRGNPVWSLKADVNEDQIPDYKQLVALAHKIDPSIVCGGDWKTPDWCHFQDRPVRGKNHA